MISTASMKSCRIIWLLMLLMVSKTCLSEPSLAPPTTNDTRWELLEAAANRIHIEDGSMTSIPPGEHHYYLWNPEHLFIKHCGPPSFVGLRQSRSLSNLCSLAKKKAIEDAIIQSCGLNIIEPVSNLVHTYWAFKSYFGSLSTIVAAAFCLALKYVIGSIIAPKKTELPWQKFPDGWIREQVAGWASSCQFRDWMMNYHRIIILPKDGIYAWYPIDFS
ncbi:hypothetical protein Hdeb2414_s0013g00414061 [Helianthus debilis subsp. tardiflorus]